MNLVQPILHHARMQPDAVAVIDGERALAYRELATEVTGMAGHLEALGVGRGDRVGLALSDGWEHIAAFLALAHCGAVTVPIDWRARPVEKARFAEPLDLKLALIEESGTFAARCPLIASDAAWRRAIEQAPPPREPSRDWEAPLVVESTSGTTGNAKCALMTHLQYYFSAADTIDLLALPARCRCLMALPLHFSYGRRGFLAHLLRGDTVILYPSLFTAPEYLAQIRRQEATVALLVPAALRQLLEIAEEGALLLPGMDALRSGGAPLFAEEKRAASQKLTPNLYDGYGTAATGTISVLRPGDIATLADSVGPPHPLMEVEIVGEDGQPLASGGIGRLRCRGPSVGTALPGAAAAAPPIEGFFEGWYYPGELADRDARGYLHLKGRASETIIRGGAKIHPTEIEAALQQHAAVSEAAVLGHRAGQEESVVAFVVARQPVALGDLVAHCRTRLTPYKVPREIRLVPQLPRNAAGKIDKAALARELADQPEARH